VKPTGIQQRRCFIQDEGRGDQPAALRKHGQPAIYGVAVRLIITRMQRDDKTCVEKERLHSLMR
jgi:hypothetical protein